MKFNKDIIVLLGIIGVVILGLMFLVILPLKDEIRESSEQFSEIKNNLALLEVKTENIEEIKQDYQSFRTDSDKINKLFIDFDAPLEFIRFLEKNAEDSGLLIKISSVSSMENEADFWPSLIFQMTLDGSSSDFLRYIQKIENSPYLIEITNLSVRKVENKVKANLSIKVYAK
ncbi:hypothetical protein KAS79_02535 [Candidatus Parcubacteria bacterium]|nr:hypothetical protein [Candidatus Parcubacteria bacterium]